MNIFKKCYKCEVEKFYDDFYKNKSKKDGLADECKECSKKRHKQWRENNKNNIKESKKQYFNKNKNIILEKHKQYYIKNKEYISNQKKKYRENNKEKLQKISKIWRENNREYSIKYLKLWYENNKEYNIQYRNNHRDKMLQYEHKRNANKLNQLGFLPYNYIQILEERDTYCKYCNLHIKIYGYHIDHIIPLSKGGLHDINNLQLICASCNHKKGNKLEEEFITILL